MFRKFSVLFQINYSISLYLTETPRRRVLMGFSLVERLTDRREKEACKRGRCLSSFLFFLQITIITILSRDLVSLHKRLIVVRASCLQYRFGYSFSKPCSQTALETLRRPKTIGPFIRGKMRRVLHTYIHT